MQDIHPLIKRQFYRISIFLIFFIALISFLNKDANADNSEFGTGGTLLKSLPGVDDTFFLGNDEGNIYVNYAPGGTIVVYDSDGNVLHQLSRDYDSYLNNGYAFKNINSDKYDIAILDMGCSKYFSYSNYKCYFGVFIYSHEYKTYYISRPVIDTGYSGTTYKGVNIGADSNGDIVIQYGNSSYHKITYDGNTWSSSPALGQIISLPSNSYFKNDGESSHGYYLTYNSGAGGRLDFVYTLYTYNGSSISGSSTQLGFFESVDTYSNNSLYNITTTNYLPFQNSGFFISLRFSDNYVRTCYISESFQKGSCSEGSYFIYFTDSITGKKLSDPSQYIEGIDFSPYNAIVGQDFSPLDSSYNATYVFESNLYVRTSDLDESVALAPGGGGEDIPPSSEWSFTTSGYQFLPNGFILNNFVPNPTGGELYFEIIAPGYRKGNGEIVYGATNFTAGPYDNVSGYGFDYATKVTTFFHEVGGEYQVRVKYCYNGECVYPFGEDYNSYTISQAEYQNSELNIEWDVQSCNDGNQDAGFLPGVSNFFLCASDTISGLLSGIADFFSSIKEFFTSFGNIVTDEVNTFSFIPKASAEGYIGENFMGPDEGYKETTIGKIEAILKLLPAIAVLVLGITGFIFLNKGNKND